MFIQNVKHVIGRSDLMSNVIWETGSYELTIRWDHNNIFSNLYVNYLFYKIGAQNTY